MRLTILMLQLAEFGECFQNLVTGIGAVGEEVAQPREEVVDGFDDERCPSRSCTSAGWTAAPTIRPLASVTI